MRPAAGTARGVVKEDGMKAIAIGALVVLGVVGASTEARAQENGGRRPIVIHLDPIIGKRVRPLAAVDVARTALKTMPAELQASFVGKIEAELDKQPF